MLLLGCDAAWLLLEDVSIQLVVNAKVVVGSLILSALMMETMRSPETSLLANATRRHIPEDNILLGFLLLRISENGQI
jgi:hypothetical protein